MPRDPQARNRAPGIVWGLSATDLNRGYVRTLPGDLVLVVARNPTAPPDADLLYLQVDRYTARLLARRINECLDSTRYA